MAVSQCTRKVCTADQCELGQYAIGLCRRHYKRTRPRSPDRKVPASCDCCGDIYMRYAHHQDRYQAHYCSMLCRDYARYGPLSRKIPANHWSKHYGSTSEWKPPVIRNSGDCQWCGADNPRNQSAAYCSQPCKMHAKSARRRAAQHGAPGLYRFSEVMRQYQRQGYTCAYCRQPARGLPDPEHVHPLSKGGRNDMANIVAACRPCNSDKRDLTLDEWAIDRARRGRPAVRTQLTGTEFLHLAL